jgi:small-conductance mechanosensitive channel
MQVWFDQLTELTGLSAVVLERVLETLAVLVVVLLSRILALRVMRRRIDDVKRSYYWRRVVNYAAGFLVVALVGHIWFSGLQNLGTFLGLVSAGVAVALSDLLTNLAGWVFVMTRRPFVVGDRIQIGDTTGDVIDIRLFQTYLLECGAWVDADQSTGRIVMVPNGAVFKQTTANYTRGFEHIWDELPVLITFESDWRRAKEILVEIAGAHAEHLSKGAQEQIRRAARKHMIFFRNLTPIVYTDVKESGVQLSIRFLTNPRQRRSAKERIWEAILDAFEAEPRIDLAYPTVRYYRGYVEGKPEMRPPAPPPIGTVGAPSRRAEESQQTA